MRRKLGFAKTVVHGFLMVGLSLALTSQAAAQSSQTQNVDADVTSALRLEMTTQFAPTPWNLAQGNNVNSSMVLTAFSNVPYAVRANCDSSAPKAGYENRLWEFRGGTYLTNTEVPGGGAAKYINAPLNIQQVGGGGSQPIDPNPAGVGIVGATGQAPTASSGRAHNLEVSQFIDYGDVSLSSSGATSAYHMVITFTIIAGSV